MRPQVDTNGEALVELQWVDPDDRLSMNSIIDGISGLTEQNKADLTSLLGEGADEYFGVIEDIAACVGRRIRPEPTGEMRLPTDAEFIEAAIAAGMPIPEGSTPEQPLGPRTHPIHTTARIPTRIMHLVAPLAAEGPDREGVMAHLINGAIAAKALAKQVQRRDQEGEPE